jgi:hypothetical protein
MSTAVRALAALLLLALVGCGGGSSPRSPQAEPSVAPDRVLSKGTCWDDARLSEALGADTFDEWVQKYAGGDTTLGASLRDDVAFTRKIECSEPHALELYDVVALAPSLTARITTYAALLDQKSPLYRSIRDQVNDRCQADSPYGLAQRRAGGLPVQLAPSLSASGGLHMAWDPFPPDLWEKGQRKFVCTFEQDRPGTLRFADLTTSKVPVAARVCLNTPLAYVPCSSRHQAEDIAEMFLNTAVEKGQISGRKAVRTGPKGPYVALTDAEYAKLDKICQTLFGEVSTVKGGVSARAYPGAVSQWPTATGTYLASCFALKPAVPLPMFTGTVFDKG